MKDRRIEIHEGRFWGCELDHNHYETCLKRVYETKEEHKAGLLDRWV